jgi:hypothetical protein
VLAPHASAYEAFDPDFGFLFNFYYEATGPRHARPRRGTLTRPSSVRVTEYRAHVDAAMTAVLAAPDLPAEVESLVDLDSGTRSSTRSCC